MYLYDVYNLKFDFSRDVKHIDYKQKDIGGSEASSSSESTASNDDEKSGASIATRSEANGVSDDVANCASEREKAKKLHIHEIRVAQANRLLQNLEAE